MEPIEVVAKNVYEELGQITGDVLKMADADVKIIVDALAHRERDTWEEAAQLCANAVRFDGIVGHGIIDPFTLGYNRACQEMECKLNDMAIAVSNAVRSKHD